MTEEGGMEVEVQLGEPGGGMAEWALGGTRVDSLSFYFPSFLSLSFPCLAVWGEGDWGALLGSIVSIWGRIWSCKEKAAAVFQAAGYQIHDTHWAPQGGALRLVKCLF